jgi:hypothetical protein
LLLKHRQVQELESQPCSMTLFTVSIHNWRREEWQPRIPDGPLVQPKHSLEGWIGGKQSNGRHT